MDDGGCELAGDAGLSDTVWGDYTGRVKGVSVTAWDPATSAMATVQIAQYQYDSSGRLRAEWDPRLTTNPLVTTYSYDSAGHVTEIHAPGTLPVTLGYGSYGMDSNTGRLLSVSQSALSAGTAVTSVVYGVALSGGSAPADLSSSQTSRWGQTDLPTDATAIIPPVTSGSTSSDLPKGVVHYLDVNGREVNTLSPGGRLSTTEYDSVGNTVRSLSNSNRLRALNVSNTDSSSAEAGLARLEDSQSLYSTDGLDLLETFEPERTTMVGGAAVRARAHTVTSYTQHLATSVAVGARVAGSTSDTDTRTTVTDYDYTLKQPTNIAVDPAGLNLISRTSYDSSGLVLTQSQPGSSTTSTAETTVNTYYTTAANATYAECGGRAEWAGLLCRTGPAGSLSGLTATWTQYDMFNQAISMVETAATATSSSSPIRTTTATYDALGRPSTTAISATTTPTSATVPTTRTTYTQDGQVDEVQSLDGSGAVTSYVKTSYDTLGRVTSYRDADANTSSDTSFDLQGRSLHHDDGKGTVDRTYDTSTGELTQLVDSDAGTFTATYDGDGSLSTIGYPGGLVAKTVTDETGSATSLTYSLTSGCSSDCDLLTDRVSENVHGQQVSHDGLSRQTYVYDSASRLTGVTDQYGAVCDSRAYFFDNSMAAGKDSNRTGEASATGLADTCPALPTVASTTHSYDAASRTTDSGYVHDALGRITTLPAAGTLDATVKNPTYYANDMARTLGSSTYTLDVFTNRMRSITTAAGTSTQHFDDGGDSPSWTTTPGAATWTRNISGPAGDLAALRNPDGSVAIQLADLHGDTVATTTTTPAADRLNSTFESTEFGAPRLSGDVGTRRFGWLGAKARPADNPSGVILMGVRLYDPATGRFLTTDPVPGGNANAYIYPADPINGFDLDGKFCMFGRNKHHGCRGGHYARLARNGINMPASAVGWGLAKVTGASCHSTYDDMTICRGGAKWMYSRRGTTWGSVYMTNRTSGADRRLMRHESKHANQFAWFGGFLNFPMVYGVTEHFRSGDRNPWERQAGLRDGCYRARRGCD